MSEYHNFVGKRAELREDALRLEIQGKSHVESLRVALDPTTPISELDPEKIMGLAVALAESINKAVEVKSHIAAINKCIGQRP